MPADVCGFGRWQSARVFTFIVILLVNVLFVRRCRACRCFAHVPFLPFCGSLRLRLPFDYLGRYTLPVCRCSPPRDHPTFRVMGPG